MKSLKSAINESMVIKVVTRKQYNELKVGDNIQIGQYKGPLVYKDGLNITILINSHQYLVTRLLDHHGKISINTDVAQYCSTLDAASYIMDELKEYN